MTDSDHSLVAIVAAIEADRLSRWQGGTSKTLGITDSK